MASFGFDEAINLLAIAGDTGANPKFDDNLEDVLKSSENLWDLVSGNRVTSGKFNLLSRILEYQLKLPILRIYS